MRESQEIEKRMPLKIPLRLCRVTRDFLVDPQGYLLSHETREKPDGGYTRNINGFDQRSLPLVHPSEWEVIARMFAWHEYRKSGATFKLLTIDTKIINILGTAPHGVLDYPEYFGMVPKSAILTTTEYTWVKDGSQSILSQSAKNNWPNIFAWSEGYSPVPLKSR